MGRSGAPSWRRLALAGAVVAAVTVSVTGAANSHRVPVSSSGKLAAIPDQSPSPSPSPSPTVDPEAARILNGAALVAAQQPDPTARGARYLFVEWIFAQAPSSGINPETGKPDKRDPPTLYRMWLPADGTGNGLIRKRPVADPHAWTEEPIPESDVPFQNPAPLGVPEGVPTDADEMLAYLYRSTTPNPSRDPGAFIDGIFLIEQEYFQPAVVSAAFAALARIPGLTVEREVIDAAGRQGVSVGCLWVSIRRELIFDPQTYAFLGARNITVEDPDRQFPPGLVIDSTAYLRSGIVDELGQVP
jgi:hypothetical protein